MRVTITEALAEIETIGKRIAAKRELVSAYIEAAAADKIGPEVQAILQLEDGYIKLRRAIARAYDGTPMGLDIGQGQTIERPIAEWIIWRNELVPAAQEHSAEMGRRALLAGTPRLPASLMHDAEVLAALLDAFFVQMARYNATVVIEVPD